MKNSVTDKNIFFSIVIPTLNEEKYLPLLLQDLSAQTNNNFEVIHIDGESNDKTVKLAKLFDKKLNIQTKVVKIKNVSYQRNAGIKLAKGKWIIFMDADNRIEPSFLDGIKYKIAQNNLVDLFTTWVSVDKGKSINRPIEKTLNFALELSRLIKKEWSFGALIGVKKEIVDKLKFDEKQRVGEDGLFVKLLIESGYVFKIFKDPRYNYSLRRLETEGILKYTRSVTKITLNYFMGKDFQDKDFDYPMKGGGYYGNKNYFDFSKLPQHIKSLPKKQLEQAKNLFKKLTDTDL